MTSPGPRRVSVRLEADISQYVSGTARAAAATTGLGQTVQRESRTIERALGDAGARGADRLVRDAGGRLRNARGQFATDAEIMASGLDPVMERKGRDAGSKLSQGINASLIRNSPLIAAAVGGALVAGAPAALAGAAMLFGGVAAVAGAQSAQVQSAWTALGDEITRGTIEDASVVIPALAGMADDLGDSFGRLRPQLRDAFEATAPLVETFTRAVTGAAENAMPGLVRAVQSAEPVMAGFRSFMESVGTGVSEMFDTLADNAPAAGQSFAALGDVIAQLLPTIGELLGAGAQLASVVLPPVADALEDVASVVATLAPALPALAAGFAGLRLVNGVGGSLASLSTRLSEFAAQGGVASGAATNLSNSAGRASRAISGLGQGLPLVGALVGVLAAGMSEAEGKVNKWAQALVAGGDAAARARAEYQADLGDQVGWARATDEALGFAASFDEAERQAAELRASMTPLELAQLRVSQSQRDVSAAVGEFGANSPQAIAAVGEYERAQAELQRQEAETQRAIEGVTAAMVAQAEQALLSVDAELAYDRALDTIQQSSIDVAAAIRDHGFASEEASDASRQLEEDVIAAARAAGDMAAQALPANTSELQRNAAAQEGTYRELVRLRDEMGSNFPPAGQRAIDKLQAAGVSLRGTGGDAVLTRQRMEDLGLTVQGMPDYRRIVIDAPTEDQKRRLLDLGYTVRELPDGRVEITADTGPANARIEELERRITRAGGYTTVVSGQGIQGGRNRATGAVVSYYADGGLRPMRADVAEVVPANTWRVIGDRPVGDEAFIPINNSARSQAILEETASRMGYGLARQDLRYLARGGILGRYTYPVDVTNAKLAEIERSLSATVASAAGGAPGGGSVGGGWRGLWDTIRRAFPEARLNSAYRPGDPGYHGRGRAVDLGWSRAPGGIGNAYMASMNRWIHDRYGARSAELIYDGLGDDRPDLKNGRPLTYNAATRAAHRNHVHWAMANGGIIREPVLGRGMWSGGSYSFGERGPETVQPGVRSREFGGGGGSGGGIDYRRLAAAIAAQPPRTGPVMNVEAQYVNSGVDLDLALRQAEFRERMGAF